MSERLFLEGVGAVTPLGRSAIETGAALRAGHSGLAEWSGFSTRGAEPPWDAPRPVIAGAVTEHGLQRAPARLVELARHALQELVVTRALRRADLTATKLHLCLPNDPHVLGSAVDAFAPFAVKLGLSPDVVAGVHRGRQGVAQALRGLMARPERAIVLAADTLLSVERLRALDDAGRLRSEMVLDGVFPAEAAIAMLLTPSPGELGVEIEALGWGEEPHPYTSDRSSSGRGLVSAVGAVWDEACPWWIGDDRGPSYFAREWGIAKTRLPYVLGDIITTDEPLGLTGDCGAASGGLLLLHAYHGAARRCAPHERGLITLAGDDSFRAALRFRIEEGT